MDQQTRFRSAFSEFGGVSLRATLKRRVVGGMAVLALLWPLSAQAQLTALLLAGDTAPGTGGGSFASFGSPNLNDLGEAAFTANLSGGSSITGVFVESPTSGTSVVALRGDTAPGAAGGTFQTFAGVQINASGEVAFHSTIVGGSASSGIFLLSGGTLSAVVLGGDVAPGTGNGTFNVPSAPKLNDAGTIAFSSLINGGQNSEGIFRVESGSISAVVLAFEAVPGIPGGFFTDLQGPSLGEGGEVGFYSEFFGGGLIDRGIFIDNNGSISAVAIEGDSAPGTGGSVWTQPSVQRPPVTADGAIVFGSGFAGGAVSEFGLFRDVAGTQSEILFTGDVVPGTGGATLESIQNEISANAAGDVAFEAQFNAGGSFDRGIFLVRNDALEAIAIAGDPAPGTGGQFRSFGREPGLNAQGDIAFSARAQFGIASQGIWFLPEPTLALPLALGTLLLSRLDRRRQTRSLAIV